MGVVNVTPDSFSDGGSYASAAHAADAARRMLADGAALVDVGGESTRPGADPVSQDEELRRVLPVLEALTGRPLSVDTSRTEVARRAVALGAVMVNDVSALRREPALAEVVAEADVDVCLMHMRGIPRTMQDDPRYDDVVSDVASFLEERIAFAVEAGIAEDRICVDPGIGFGKTAEHNLAVSGGSIGSSRSDAPCSSACLASRRWRASSGEHVAVGSDAASVGAAVAAFDRGAALFRVHEVRPHVEALAAAAAVERGSVVA